MPVRLEADREASVVFRPEAGDGLGVGQAALLQGPSNDEAGGAYELPAP